MSTVSNAELEEIQLDLNAGGEAAEQAQLRAGYLYSLALKNTSIPVKDLRHGELKALGDAALGDWGGASGTVNYLLNNFTHAPVTLIGAIQEKAERLKSIVTSLAKTPETVIAAWNAVSSGKVPDQLAAAFKAAPELLKPEVQAKILDHMAQEHRQQLAQVFALPTLGERYQALAKNNASITTNIGAAVLPPAAAITIEKKLSTLNDIVKLAEPTASEKRYTELINAVNNVEPIFQRNQKIIDDLTAGNAKMKVQIHSHTKAEDQLFMQAMTNQALRILDQMEQKMGPRVRVLEEAFWKPDNNAQTQQRINDHIRLTLEAMPEDLVPHHLLDNMHAPQQLELLKAATARVQLDFTQRAAAGKVDDSMAYALWDGAVESAAKRHVFDVPYGIDGIENSYQQSSWYYYIQHNGNPENVQRHIDQLQNERVLSQHVQTEQAAATR
jgi:hypothetical protein